MRIFCISSPVLGHTNFLSKRAHLGRCHLGLELGLDGLHVDVGGDPVFTGHLGSVHGEGEILGHDPVDVDGLGTTLLELGSKLGQLGGVVELGSEGETPGPGEYRGDRVGRRLVTLLELSVVPGDGTVSGLGLHGRAIGSDELGRHHTETTESLSENVTLCG